MNEIGKYVDMIIERVELKKVVSRYVGEMKSSGGRLWACCPFHQEKTPSFCIDPAKNLWHCYGSCQDGGTVIKFIEKIENLSFRQAVEFLLKSELGIDVHHESVIENFADLSMFNRKELQAWFNSVFDEDAPFSEQKKVIDSICDKVVRVDEDLQEELLDLFAHMQGTKQLWRNAYNSAMKRLKEVQQ